jgi:glycosyltransferase involved in cell wall biosynthesis
MTGRPFFSVIMPVYNRAAVVGRAIRSCLAQEEVSFELIAVDDGSTDDSVAAVKAFDDPRIRLMVHEQNRGPCPARNTAMAAARGEWFVFLDSDDELLPGALQTIQRRALAAPPDVGVLRFMCVDEEGTSPVPPHQDQILDYEDYLRWIESAVKAETLPCVRADMFPNVRYVDSHAMETWYHLELARNTRLMACSDVVRRYHHDMPDRLTAPTPERDLRYASDVAEDAARILDVHGDALRRCAPRTYRMRLSHASSSSFLAGRRMDGLRYAMRAWRLTPFAPRLYAIALFGLLGPRPLARLKQFWRRASTA